MPDAGNWLAMTKIVSKSGSCSLIQALGRSKRKHSSWKLIRPPVSTISPTSFTQLDAFPLFGSIHTKLFSIHTTITQNKTFQNICHRCRSWAQFSAHSICSNCLCGVDSFSVWKHAKVQKSSLSNQYKVTCAAQQVGYLRMQRGKGMQPWWVAGVCERWEIYGAITIGTVALTSWVRCF